MSTIENASERPDLELLAQLEPAANRLYDEHMVLSEKHIWYPHKETPWSYGKDFDPDYLWTPEESLLSPELTSALFVNLLTEDNLPYYFDEIDNLFGGESVWGKWGLRWTAEEGRHAEVIRTGLMTMRLVDPVLLEDDRMKQVSGGVVPRFERTLDGIMYVAIQELATLVSHKRTAARMVAEANLLSSDVDRAAVLKVAGGIVKVMGDESRHHKFYLGLAMEAFKILPDKAMESLFRIIKNFEMPGTGITDFDTKSSQIAIVGIYDSRVHVNHILQPVIRKLQIQNNTELSKSGESARKSVLQFVRILGGLSLKEANRLKDQRSKLTIAPDLA